MQIRSIRFRATVLYSGILAAILVLFGVLVEFNLWKILSEDIDADLASKMEEVTGLLRASVLAEEGRNREGVLGRILEMEGRGGTTRLVVDSLWASELKRLRLKEEFLQILDSRGRPLAVSANLGPDLSRLMRRRTRLMRETTDLRIITAKDGSRLRILSRWVEVAGRPMVVQIAVPFSRTLAVLERMAVLLVFSIIVILALTSFFGRILAEKILVPVRNATRVAEHIVAHRDLSVRVPEVQTDAEMTELVRAFNNMIAQLETSFQHISEFSSHVAHELKTPLAIVKGEMELTLQQEREKEDYQKAMRECLEDIDRMIRVVNDLLLLAKFDYRRDVYTYERMALDAFVRELCDEACVLAAEKEIHVEQALPKESVFIQGDRVHLRRLFLNLVHNAVRYTPPHGRIRISVVPDGRQVHVEVSDTGIGIGEEHHDKIFQKFFRVRRDETAREPGSGLGLNIARSIARAHNGEITVRSRLNEGTTFRVTFPRL